MGSPSKQLEEWAIKYSEKESLLKSFTLFFVLFELFLGFIFYHYNHIQTEHIRESLLLEMKNYSLSFGDERFDIDVTPYKPNSAVYTLLEDDQTFYMLVPFPDNTKDLLKIVYPKTDYLAQIGDLHKEMLWQFLTLSLLAALLSLVFAFYTLHPLRRSLRFLERFIKDIIHDLNTPLTSILINLKMMDRHDEEVEHITRSAKTIAMLHHNLDAYLKEQQGSVERFDLAAVVEEQVAQFRPMYHYLQWKVDVPSVILTTDKHAFVRILYNLTGNACKYNTPEGFVKITYTGHLLQISNASHGIKHPEKIFERFYKEGERGLGIGLHIVAKLCDTMGIERSIRVKDNIVTLTLDLSEVTTK